MLLTALVTLACTLGLSKDAAWAAFPDRTNLVAYWTLDEASGTRADSYGGFTLSDNASVLDGMGKIHRGADFVRSSSQYLSRSDNASLSSGDTNWTIAAWVRLDSEPMGGTMTVVSKSTGTPSTSEYSIQYTHASDRFSVSVMKDNNTTTHAASDFGNVTTGTWYHVVAWHDADNDRFGISVNGVPNSVSYSSGVNDTGEDFRIGANGGGTINAFDGIIDEVAFWKRVLTAEERAALYNSGQGAWYPGLRGLFVLGGAKTDAFMDGNRNTLQNWGGANGAWMIDRKPLKIKADFYYVRDTVRWGTRSDLPTVHGGGGEPIYHPESQYYLSEDPPASPSRGGPITAMVWGGTDYTKSMWDVYGHGWVIDGVHFMGKQDTNGTLLLQDDTPGTRLDYPYTDPLAAHPYEDRCRYAIRVRSETAAFGNGKGIFPRGLATHLFQVGILADDDPAFSNHNDQCHVVGRFAPAWCDIGFWSKQRQAFSWHFDQIESTARWTILLDAGGKLVIDELDMQTGCSIGLFVRGSDWATGTGPDETRINYINVDETAPNDCLLVKTDSNHTGQVFDRVDDDTCTIIFPVQHSIKAGEKIQITWSGGQRSGVVVDSVTSNAISVGAVTPGSGNAYPSLDTLVTVVRYSATSTIIGAAHVHRTRAGKSRGTVPYSATGADFDGSMKIISGLIINTPAPMAAGDYVEFYNETTSTTYPVFVGKISSVNDDPGNVSDSITLTTDEFFGTMPGNINNGVKLLVYRPSNEKPIVSFKNTYGIHRIDNLRLGYSRMLRAQGGLQGSPTRTIFDGVYFCGAALEASDNPIGPNWLYAGPYASSTDVTSTVARAIAMLYTTDSIGWVQGELTAAYEEPNGLTHGGERYQNLSWRGQLNGAGKFNSIDVKVW